MACKPCFRCCSSSTSGASKEIVCTFGRPGAARCPPIDMVVAVFRAKVLPVLHLGPWLYGLADSAASTLDDLLVTWAKQLLGACCWHNSALSCLNWDGTSQALTRSCWPWPCEGPDSGRFHLRTSMLRFSGLQSCGQTLGQHEVQHCSVDTVFLTIQHGAELAPTCRSTVPMSCSAVGNLAWNPGEDWLLSMPGFLATWNFKHSQASYFCWSQTWASHGQIDSLFDRSADCELASSG